MKVHAPRRFSRSIVACLVCLQLAIILVDEADAKLGHVGWAKSDSRTKQLLQNIRMHRAQQVEEEEQQSQQCDPKLPSCNVQPQKEAAGSEEESEEEILPVGRFVGRKKPPPPVKPTETKRYAEKKKERQPLPKPVVKEDKHEFKIAQEKKEAKLGWKRADEESEEAKQESRIRKEYKELKPLTGGTKKEADVKSERKKRKEDVVAIKSQDKKAKEETKPEPKLSKLTLKKPKDEPPPSLKAVKPRKQDEEKIEGKRSVKSLPKPKTEDRPKTTPVKKETIRDKKIAEKKERTENVTLKIKKRLKSKSFDEKRESIRFPDDIPVFSLTSDFVKSEQCKKHSRIYMRQLQRYKLWALMMYDASAKLPAGILQGNVNQYGDFDQCISINATFKIRSVDGISGIQGKYCLATVDISSDSRDTGLQLAIHRSQSFGFVKSKISDPGHFIPRFSTVNWGLCIPSVCSAQDLENSIKASLGTYKENAGLIFDVKVEDKNCVTKENLLSDYGLKTLVAILFYAAILGITAYATARDVFRGKADIKSRSNAEHENGQRNASLSNENSAAAAAAAAAEAEELNDTKDDKFDETQRHGESEGGIDCIYGIKSIFTMMLYFAHKTIPLALTPFSNRIVLTEISNEASSILLRGSIMYTDSFLLISGVLTAFNLGREIQRKGRIAWVRRMIARYIRLTPALLATLLIYAYISNYLGSGPIWNTVVNENSALCQRYMWRNLLYIQNFYPFEEMCAPQTHQLALDMQLYLLSPLAVYMLHEYDKVGIGILQAFLMLSSILRFTATTNNELSVIIFHGMPVSQLYKTANLLYCQSIHRATPYIVGIMVGYYLQKAGKEIVLPKAVVIVGWITTLCFAVLSFANPAHLAYQNYEYNVTEAAHYAALSPIVWSLALGWVITACHLGYGGKLNEYLSSKTLLIISRISYSVYLTQFLVFSYFVGIKRVPEMFSISGSFNITEITIVVILSLVMTLLFDIPTVEIKNVILRKDEDHAVPEQKEEEIEEKVEIEDAGNCNVKKVDLIPEMEYENDKNVRTQDVNGNEDEGVAEYEEKVNEEEPQEPNYYLPNEGEEEKEEEEEEEEEEEAEEAEFVEEELDQEVERDGENEAIEEDFWGDQKD